jgi:hypothetical protein
MDEEPVLKTGRSEKSGLWVRFPYPPPNLLPHRITVITFDFDSNNGGSIPPGASNLNRI